MAVKQVTIINPEMGAPFTMREDPFTGNMAGELSVPFGWGFYFEPQQPGDPPHRNRRPEWCPYQHWAKMFVTSGTMKAGMTQQVAVTPGDLLSMNVTACFTSTDAGIALRVGIDPFGGTDYKSSSIVWGPWQGETSEGAAYWDGGLDNPRVLVAPPVEAMTPFITLFLHAENLYPGKDGSAFWDSVVLYRHGDEEPGPDPVPGDFAELVKAINHLADVIAAKG